MNTTIIIDRVTRDVLHAEVCLDFNGAGPFANDLNTDEGVTRCMQERDRVVLCGRLLDALGWHQEATQDHYEIAASPAIAEWMTNRLGEIEEATEHNREHLRHQEAGDADWYYSGRTKKESVAISRSYIERDVLRHEALAAVLAEMSTLAVA